MIERLLAHPIRRLYTDILVRDHQIEGTCLLGQQNPCGDKMKFPSYVLLTRLRQGSPSTHPAKQAEVSGARFGGAPVREGCSGARGRDTAAMPRHVGTVPGKQSSAGDATLKGPSGEVIHPSSQHPRAPPGVLRPVCAPRTCRERGQAAASPMECKMSGAARSP